MASAVAGVEGYIVSGEIEKSSKKKLIKRKRHEDPVGYIWSENNKVYLQTLNNSEIASIKLYFEECQQ